MRFQGETEKVNLWMRILGKVRQNQSSSLHLPEGQHQRTGVYWWTQGRSSVTVGERSGTPWFWKYLPGSMPLSTMIVSIPSTEPQKGVLSKGWAELAFLPFIILWRVLLQKKVEQESDPSTYVTGHWKGCQYMLYTDLSRLEMVGYSSHLDRAS